MDISALFLTKNPVRRFGSRFIYLLAAGALCASCGVDTGLDEGCGPEVKSGQVKRSLCVEIAQYDNSVDPKNLKAVLHIRQQGLNDGEADSSEEAEEDIPGYTDADKEALSAREQAEQEASEDGEFSADEEADSEEYSQEAAEAPRDTAETIEAKEAAELRAKEAVPEEQAEMRFLAEAEADSSAEYDTEAEDADGSGEALMQGPVDSASVSGQGGRLLADFDIDPDLYPLEVESIDFIDTSADKESPFLSVPLGASAQNYLSPFLLNWEEEKRRAEERRRAESERTELNAKAVKSSSGSSALTAKIRMSNVPSKPDVMIVNYFTDSDPVAKVKSLSLSKGEYSYNKSAATATISIRETASDPRIYLLSVNDVANNKTFVNGVFDKLATVSYYYGSEQTVDLNYNNAESGFTQTPTVVIENIPGKNTSNDFYRCYVDTKALGYYSKAYYDAGSSLTELSLDYEADDKCAAYVYPNVKCENKLDDVIVSRLETSERYWEGKKTYWYGVPSVLSVDYKKFVKSKAVDESNLGMIAKLVVENVPYQPAKGTASYYYYSDSAKQTHSFTLKGMTYDKARQRLTAFINVPLKDGDYGDIVVNKIKIDNYTYSGYLNFWTIARTLSADWNAFTGKEADLSGYKQVYCRVDELPYAPDVFKLTYTEGSDTAQKTVNVASFRNGLLSFGRILTTASSITLKNIEVGTKIYKINKKIDLKSSDAHLEIVSYSKFGKNSDMISRFTAKVEGVPSFKEGKAKYRKGDSDELYTWNKASYDKADKNVLFNITSYRSVIDLVKLVVNNRYKYVSAGTLKSGNTYAEQYADMSAVSFNCRETVSGVASKPKKSVLTYALWNDPENIRQVSGTWDEAKKKINFRFKTKEDAVIIGTWIDSQYYGKKLSLTYPNPTKTISFGDFKTTCLVIKNAKKANVIEVVYDLYNSKTGACSCNYTKTTGAYDEALKAYTMPFTLSRLNGSDYDTVRIWSAALDNRRSYVERQIKIGKTYNLLFTGLHPEYADYCVDVYSGYDGIFKYNSGTMTYTAKGERNTVDGEFCFNGSRYVMRFWVFSDAGSIKVNQIKIDKKRCSNSFVIKYGQNKKGSTEAERNTKTMSMSSFK